MSSGIAREMSRDRIEGNFRIVSEDERLAELKELGAKNWEQPPLEVSPCVKVIKTGEIFYWNMSFAARPDLVVNCDENGDTDPARWRGRRPLGVNAAGEQVDVYTAKELARRQVPTPPPGLHFNMREFDSEMASKNVELGTIPVSDYADCPPSAESGIPLSGPESQPAMVKIAFEGF